MSSHKTLQVTFSDIGYVWNDFSGYQVSEDSLNLPCCSSDSDFNHTTCTQVRVGQLKQGGEFTTKQIGEHHDRAHKLALEPGSPHILYSCGEDGLVQHVCHCSVLCY